jgi:tRNA (guanine37-N1)-methyltransferase
VAAATARQRTKAAATRTIHLSPAGAADAPEVELAAVGDSTGYVGWGRYEGSTSVITREVDEEIAIGDFVVSGGEPPALMLIDATTRQRPGVLNDAESAAQDSFVAGRLDCPHYTRPECYEGVSVPEVLLSGHHAAIRRRLMQSLGRMERRPELRGAPLTDEETRCSRSTVACTNSSRQHEMKARQCRRDNKPRASGAPCAARSRIDMENAA